MGWWNPLSPVVPVTNPGAGSAAQDPHKIGTLCWKPEHPNQLVWPFPAHPLSLWPHWNVPPSEQWGPDWGKGQGDLWPSFPLSHFHCGWFWLGVREEMLGAYFRLLQLVPAGDWPTFPQFPPDWFKVLAGVAHSQAIWPWHWHLKHCKKLVSFLLMVPSLDSWVFCAWPLLVVVAVLWLTDALWAEVVCPRLVQPLWELGRPRVLLSICPLPWPLCLGLFGALAGLLPCPALVRMAINLVIWYPNSIVPSTGSVVMTDLALTLLWSSSFSLSALQAAVISWE